MGKTLTSRVSDDLAEEIEKIAEIEKLDKSSVIRRLLDRGISQWKEEFALKRYQDGEASLGKAAEICSVTVWEFLDKLAEKKIPLNYDAEDLMNDIETVGNILKKK